MNSSNNLRSRVNSGKSLKCGKLSRQVIDIVLCLFTMEISFKRMQIAYLLVRCRSYGYWFAFLFILTCSQDQGLDMISDGLDTLKNMAQDMNEVSCFCVMLLTHLQYINIC